MLFGHLKFKMANFMYQFLSKYDIIKKSKSMEGFIMNEEPELYSNAMSISNTFFDFILDFKKETIVEDETGRSDMGNRAEQGAEADNSSWSG